MINFDNTTPHLAGNYDSQISRTIPYYASFHQETINLINAMQLQPSSWLDTGCGTGTFVQKALVTFPDTRFVLSDPSKEMLSTAEKKLEGTARGRISFLKPA